MKFRYLLPLLVVLLLVVAACTPPPNLRDENFLQDISLLTGQPCEAPCWRGITPGETEWRDAVIMVEDDPQLTGVEQIEDEESDARILNFGGDDGPECCRLYTLDGDTVSAILTLLAPEMVIGDIIDKYGDPAYVAGGDVTPDQTLLSLIFPDVPVVVYVFAAGTAEGELTPNNDVIGAIYPSQNDLEEILTSTQMYNWEGYVTLADYLDGNFDVEPQQDNAEADVNDEE